MDGFAQGLIAGFQTVDGAMQRRKEMGLREAEMAQRQKNTERSFQMAEDEFGHKKEVDQRNFDYQRDRDQVGDERWGKEFGLKALDTKTRLGVAQQQQSMQKEAHDFRMNNARYEKMIQQYEPQIKMAQQAIQAGDYEAARKIMADVPDDVPLARLLRDPVFAQSTVTAGQKLYGIMSSEDVRKNPQSAMDLINDNMKDIAPLFQPEADRAVGQVDPTTGKKIVSSRINHIGPVPDGKEDGQFSADEIAVFQQVTYDDGSVVIKPVTEHRSSDSRDNVKRINIPQLLKGASERVVQGHNYLKYLQQPQGLSQTEIDKGAIKVATEATKDGKDVAAALDSYKAGFGDPVAKERLQLAQATEAAKGWVGDDPVKNEFASVMLRNNPVVFIPGNEDDLKKSYQNFKERNTNTQKKLKDESASHNVDYLRKQRQLQQQQQNDFLYGSD
ncbi:hypothetical protein D6T51_07580 [Salmonella enterica subsp. enterica serovar Muenchen]|nr:hypothetical protein [Salmonella enterica subsp. enterica serovar Muenchen]EJM3644014.1 hypothetical protein [Salmonella enterica]